MTKKKKREENHGKFNELEMESSAAKKDSAARTTGHARLGQTLQPQYLYLYRVQLSYLYLYL